MAARTIFRSSVLFCVFSISQALGQGQVKDGDRVILPPEGRAKIQWQFNIKDIKKVLLRAWYFTSSDGTFDDELLAQIDGDNDPVIESKRLAALKIEKPATLVLNKVNQSYNGSYTFTISAGRDGGVSTITIIIAEKPKVTVSCSSINPVIEGENFTCLCKGKGGNPAPANVTWYDNNGQTIGTGKGEKLLILNKVTKAKSGSYKCEAKTHEQAKNETSIELIVKFIVSYSMPVGQRTKNGKVEYKDTNYAGVIINDFYQDGTGILTDGKFGPVDAKSGKKGERGKGWVGWNNIKREYIDIIFEFSDVRKFKDVTLTVNVAKDRSHVVFSKSQIFFASTEDSLPCTSFLKYCPRGYEAQDNPYNARVTLSLCENTARFIKLRLYFGGIWLLITEISFNSVPAIKDEKKFLHCSDRASHSCPITPSRGVHTSFITASTVTLPTTKILPTKTPPTPEYEEKISSVAMFFAGAAVTLLIVLLILFVIQIYKRRCRSSKLSTSDLEVDLVEMQNQTTQAEHPTEASRNHQELSNVSPAGSETSPYEDVPISPSSVYTELDKNKRDLTDDSSYQKLVKHHSGHMIPADDETGGYEEIGRCR